MLINVIDEYNENGHLMYSDNFKGAFTRGKTRDEAILKFSAEIRQYCEWLSLPCDNEFNIEIIHEKYSELNISDADSDVIFPSEKEPLTLKEYQSLKEIALKSAQDFNELYRSIPDKNAAVLSPRKTFYGNVPITAEEMYNHTKNVNSYYFGEINIDASNEPDIYICRKEGFTKLECSEGFLNNIVFDGSYGEQWSVRKVMRRFIWHDRIHAKAMYRMALRLFGKENIKNPFCFFV